MKKKGKVQKEDLQDIEGTMADHVSDFESIQAKSGKDLTEKSTIKPPNFN